MKKLIPILALLAFAGGGMPDQNTTIREGGIFRADVCVLAMGFEAGIADDVSGEGNHGVISGATHIPATQTSSGAMEFDGGDDYINLGDDTSLRANSSQSVFFWVKNQESGTDIGMLGKYDTDGNNREWIFLHTNAGGIGTLRVLISEDGTTGNSKDYITNDAILYDAKWHQIGYTWISGTLKLYCDGSELTAITKTTDTSFTTAIQSSADVIIGAFKIGGVVEREFDGIIDEPLIYTHALAPPEVMDLYRAGKPRH